LVALAISSSPVAFRNRVSLQLASVVTPEINQNINSPPTGAIPPQLRHRRGLLVPSWASAASGD
jgi:hypothetical protein